MLLGFHVTNTNVKWKESDAHKQNPERAIVEKLKAATSHRGLINPSSEDWNSMAQEKNLPRHNLLPELTGQTRRAFKAVAKRAWWACADPQVKWRLSIEQHSTNLTFIKRDKKKVFVEKEEKEALFTVCHKKSFCSDESRMLLSGLCVVETTWWQHHDLGITPPSNIRNLGALCKGNPRRNPYETSSVVHVPAGHLP